jgi:large subunit ribosomal protein L32e
MAKKSTTKASEPAEKPEKKKKAAAAKKPAKAKEKTVKKAAAPAKKKPAKAKEKAPEAKEEKKQEAKKAPAAKKTRHIEKIKFREKKDITEVAKLRKKTPRFTRQEFGKFAKLDDKWRTPRGCDSKKDEGKRGKGASPKIGYKRPASAREIHPSGFYPIMVRNPTELSIVDPKFQGAIIAAAVGRKKRNEIIKAANNLSITILNPRKGEV